MCAHCSSIYFSDQFPVIAVGHVTEHRCRHPAPRDLSRMVWQRDRGEPHTLPRTSIPAPALSQHIWMISTEPLSWFKNISLIISWFIFLVYSRSDVFWHGPSVWPPITRCYPLADNETALWRDHWCQCQCWGWIFPRPPPEALCHCCRVWILTAGDIFRS